MSSSLNILAGISLPSQCHIRFWHYLASIQNDWGRRRLPRLAQWSDVKVRLRASRRNPGRSLTLPRDGMMEGLGAPAHFSEKEMRGVRGCPGKQCGRSIGNTAIEAARAQPAPHLLDPRTSLGCPCVFSEVRVRSLVNLRSVHRSLQNCAHGFVL
jgi:hypothetical protein